jgi:hypothetical protein
MQLLFLYLLVLIQQITNTSRVFNPYVIYVQCTVLDQNLNLDLYLDLVNDSKWRICPDLDLILMNLDGSRSIANYLDQNLNLDIDLDLDLDLI